jgi:NAD(P)-dependent dehydrogenase (short-subunit alcohol dehydrogenase family)
MSVVLITGCSSGFGLETALAFARRGDTVVATMRTPEKAGALLDRAAQEGVSVEVVALDVTDDRSVLAAVGEVADRHGSVDVLVNNAGVGYSGPIETIDIDRARTVVETIVWGAVRTLRAVLPHMRAQGAGVIVNVSSAAARLPGGGYAAFYSASKHALSALSESLAWEVAQFGIRVVCLEPGFYATAIGLNSDTASVDLTSPYAADDAYVAEFYNKSIAAGGDPAVVADAIVAAVDDPSTPMHVLVGDDAITFVDMASQVDSFEAWTSGVEQALESVLGRPRPRSLEAVELKQPATPAGGPS